MLKDTFEIEITDIAYGGDGVGRFDGKAVFVPGTAIGEKVLVRKLSEKKRFARAFPLEITEASPERIESVCPFALRAGETSFGEPYCPGCAFQHIGYGEEIRVKNSQFADFLKRHAKAGDYELLPPLKSPLPLACRNKISLHFDGNALGYFAQDNRTVIDVPSCPLACDGINDELRRLREDSAFMDSLNEGDTLTLRHTFHDGTSFYTGTAFRRGQSLAFHREKTLLGDIKFPAGAFFQVNSSVCDILVSEVLHILNLLQPEAVVDFHCGSGLFSLAAATAGAKRVAGIDSHPQSVRAARENACANGFDNCDFHTGKAGENALRLLKKIGSGSTVLVFDPPRAGLEKSLTEAVDKMKIKSIIYISCAPDTLSRDLRMLLDCGFRLCSARLIDMFPRTAHFESITHIERD